MSRTIKLFLFIDFFKVLCFAFWKIEEEVHKIFNLGPRTKVEYDEEWWERMEDSKKERKGHCHEHRESGVQEVGKGNGTLDGRKIQ